MTSRPREEVIAAFRLSDPACENRDHLCSCLECVLARQKNRPVVVFEPEDIEWNKKIEGEKRGWHLAFLAVACWVWFAAMWQTVEWVGLLWGELWLHWG